jgi:hypothetical protein
VPSDAEKTRLVCAKVCSKDALMSMSLGLQASEAEDCFALLQNIGTVLKLRVYCGLN